MLKIKIALGGRFFIVLDCYLGTTLCAASFNHCSACFCGNTRTKAVRFGAVTSVGLKCSLWHILYILPKLTPFSKLGLEFYQQGLY